MHIVYAVTTCSDRTYAALFQDCPQKPAFQSQKYHRLLIEGLSQLAEVDVAATLPVNRANCGKNLLRLPPETEGGARYHYAPASRQPLLKALLGALGTYRNVTRLAKKGDAVFVDCLNCTTALFAQLAARAKGCRCVGIVTDLPEMLGGSRPYLALTGRVIRGCTDYIFLTEQMNSRLNPSGKPHLVLEGHADISMADRDPGAARKASPRVCLYAGSVCRLYGLPQLVEGFRMANIPDTRLVIYGPGDYVEELKAIAEKGPSGPIRRHAPERPGGGKGDAGQSAHQPPAHRRGIRPVFLPLQNHGVYGLRHSGADHPSAGNAQGILPLCELHR